MRPDFSLNTHYVSVEVASFPDRMGSLDKALDICVLFFWWYAVTHKGVVRRTVVNFVDHRHVLISQLPLLAAGLADIYLELQLVSICTSR